MQTCPVCRITLGKIRNLAVEKILAQYERPCKYNNYGCTALITANALKAHNDVCNYQLVPCPWHGCVKVISLSEMPKHLIEIHKICKLDTLSIGYDDMREIIKSHGTRLLNPALFTFGDFDFCAGCWRSIGLHGRWHVWLYMVGPPDKSKRYIYTVQVTSSRYNQELSYTGETISLQIEREQITTMGRCLTFDDEIAKRFCEGDGIQFSYSIRCINNI
jgi:E3 ubiquitin-protein ligase SIAH1